MFLHIANIDNTVFQATVEYFVKLWAKWTNLPLTTLMISSPWEVYAWQKLDYTTDTLPVEIPSWFLNDRKNFLCESYQFIEEYILSYEKELLNKTDLSDEDKIIKDLL
jgi:hypothetical protein